MANPSLEEFIAAARPLNPDATDDEIVSYWRQNYAPKVEAPSLDAFVSAAKPLNPSASDDEIKSYWEANYKSAYEAANNRTWGQFAGDMAVKAGQGVIGLGESAVGLADIATGGAVGAGLEKIGYDPDRAKEMLGNLSSEKQKRLEQTVSAAGQGEGVIDGFVNQLSAIAKNPSFIPGAVVESLPSMLAAGGGARALAERIYSRAIAAGATEAAAAEAVAKSAGALKWAAAAGEGAISAGQIAEDARQAGRDWAQYVLPALTGGTLTAGIGRAAGAIPGLGDVETALFTRGVGAATGNRAVRTIKGAFQEGLLEEMPQSGQEQLFGNIAQGKPAGEGVGSAAAQGLVTGTAMGGGAGLISSARPVATPEPTTPPTDPIAETLSPATPILEATDLDSAIQAAASVSTQDTTIADAADRAQAEIAASVENASVRAAGDGIIYSAQNVPDMGTIAPEMGTSPVGDNAAVAPAGDTAPTTIAEQPISAPAETAPKTVGGIPVSAQLDGQSQAIPATPQEAAAATTEHLEAARNLTRSPAKQAIIDQELQARNPEARSGIPLAESQAPDTAQALETGEGRVTPTTGTALPVSAKYAQNGDLLRVRSGIPGAGAIFTLLDRHGEGSQAFVRTSSGNEISVDLGNYEALVSKERASEIEQIDRQESAKRSALFAEIERARKPRIANPDTNQVSAEPIAPNPSLITPNTEAVAPPKLESTVAKPRQVATTAEESQQGPEVERFQGKYGKGMNATPARMALKDLSAKQPDLAWSIEKTTNPEFPDRFDVVGRKINETSETTAKGVTNTPENQGIAGAQAESQTESVQLHHVGYALTRGERMKADPRGLVWFSPSAVYGANRPGVPTTTIEIPRDKLFVMEDQKGNFPNEPVRQEILRASKNGSKESIFREAEKRGYLAVQRVNDVSMRPETAERYLTPKPAKTPTTAQPAAPAQPTAPTPEGAPAPDLAALRKEYAAAEKRYAQQVRFDAAGGQKIGLTKTGKELADKAEALRRQINELERPAREAEAKRKADQRETEIKQQSEATAKRVAALPVVMRRNGWEIVKDDIAYALLDPATKEEVYRGKLKRVREVADESPPTPAPASQAAEAVKEPWQMTRQELVDLEHAASQIVATAPQGSTLSVNNVTRAERAVADLRQHKAEIAQRIKDGKPVPASVLADYPALSQSQPANSESAKAPAAEKAPIAAEKAPTVAEMSPADLLRAAAAKMDSEAAAKPVASESESAAKRSEETETKTPADSLQKPPVLSQKEGRISDKNEGETDKGTALFEREGTNETLPVTGMERGRQRSDNARASAQDRAGMDQRGSGITEQTLRQEISRAFGPKAASMVGDILIPLETQAEIEIVSDLSDVVPLIREGDLISGFYHPTTGKTYAILENLTPEGVKGLALHEIGVHYGLEGMLGKEGYTKLLRQMEVMRKAGNKAVIEAHRQATEQAAQPNQVPEEAIAYLVTNRPELPFVQRLIAQIKAFLFRKFGIGRLTVDDIAALARASVLHASEGVRNGEPQFARRIFNNGYRTARDFIVPETPEYEGNMTGDLATVPDAAAKRGVDALPVRLPVGITYGPHTGYGLMHMKENADADMRRKPEEATQDRAENFARQVVSTLKGTVQIYTEAPDKIAIYSSAQKAAVIARPTERGKDRYYSVVTVRPTERPVWGLPVWSGRLAFPDSSRGNSEPPVQSAGQSNTTTDPDRAEVQTEHFDFTKKQPTVQYKGKKLDKDTKFSRSQDQTQTAEFKKWFGDSKVIDSYRKPLTVYHGTNADVAEFKNVGGTQVTVFGPTKVGRQGFFFTDEQEAADIFASHGEKLSPGANIIPAYLAIRNPLDIRDGISDDILEEFDSVGLSSRWMKARQNDWELFDGEEGKVFVRALRDLGYDGVRMSERREDNYDWNMEVWVALEPTQIKSAIGNTGAFDPNNPDIRFARNVQGGAVGAPEWVQDQPADMQETLRKAGAWRPKQTLQERFADWTANWQQKLKQGMVDQFDPIKSLNYRAYMLARMTKSAAGPLESALFDGTVFIDKDGAVDVNYEKGGFIGKMQALKGEHDRFFAWVVGNRAARLMEEGREHNFSKEDIARLKTLNRDKMEDGVAREVVYMKALADLNRYNKSILDMAEKAGLIDAEARPFWEKDFYIPFYRMTEGDETKGPVKSGGLVRQYAFKTLKGGERAIGDPMENILKNWAHLIDASLKNQAAVASLDAAVKVGVAHETTADEKGAVFVMKDGKKTYYGVDDPFVLDAINSMGFSGFSGPAMKVMSSFKRWLTYGVTISPTFRVRNVIRDSISMIGTNPASYNVLDNVLTGWKLTEEDSPSYASMIAGGGVIRFGTLERDSAANVKRLVDAGVEAGTILNSQAKVKAMLKDAYDWWMRVGDRSENVNRAALYQKLRDEGKSHLEASYAARDTMDFSMMGTWSAVRFLAQTVPFFNARLQGMYKLGRGAAEDPRRFAYVVGATALASIALLLAYKDDDDWKQREDFDRESFWWFKIGDKAFRIPKPFEIGAIGTLAERGLEAMITDDLTGKQFIQRMGSVVGQQLSMNPVPQLFMPMIETWANKDSFTGRAIETLGMEKLSPSERIGAYTSAFAQLAGKNGIVSPVQIDHLINGYFGWLGTHAVATADLALRPGMSLPEKPAMRVDDFFVLGDFARNLPAYQSKYVTRLYEQGKEVQQVMADMRAYQKIGATEKAAEILKDNGDKIRLYRLYTHAEQQLTKINQQIKMTQKRTGDADVKRVRLDQLYAQRNRIAKITEDRARATQR